MEEHTEFSSENCFEFTKKISQRRLFGSSGHKKVRNILKDTLKENGYNVNIHHFIGSYSEYRFMIILLLTIILSQVLFVSTYFISPILNIVSFILMMIFVKYLVDFASKYDRKTSKNEGDKKKEKSNGENIYSILKCPGNESDEEITPRKTVIFMAHYDSVSQSIGSSTRIVCFLILYFSGIINPFIVLLGSLYNLFFHPLDFSNLGSGRIVFISIILIWTSIIVICCLINIICFLSTKNESVGSVDNATSCSVIMELSRYFHLPSTKRPENIDLMFLFIDAEELGLLGSKAFVEEDNLERLVSRENTYVVNLELLGFKDAPLGLEISSGIIGKIYTDRELNKYIMKAAEDLSDDQRKPLKLAKVNPLTGIVSDHIPFLNAGWKTTMIIPSTNRRQINKIHSVEDTMEIISEEKLGEVGNLILRLIQIIDDDSIITKTI